MGSGSGDDYDYYDYSSGSRQDYDYGAPMIITEGTCSADTEEALQTDECMALLAKQPNIIKNTLELLIQYSCKDEVYNNLPISQGERKTRRKEGTGTNLKEGWPPYQV